MRVLVLGCLRLVDDCLLKAIAVKSILTNAEEYVKLGVSASQEVPATVEVPRALENIEHLEASIFFRESLERPLALGCIFNSLSITAVDDSQSFVEREMTIINVTVQSFVVLFATCIYELGQGLIPFMATCQAQCILNATYIVRQEQNFVDFSTCVLPQF